MKKHTAKPIPLLTREIGASAALATGLLSTLALGAPGDLDAAFGDLGRLGPILRGPAWASEDLEDDTTLVAGGDVEPSCDFYCYYYYYTGYSGFDATNFVNLISDTGSIDPIFTMDTVVQTQVLDIVRQADGQVVAVGRKVSASSTGSQLTVFRLDADGSLDPAFGEGGIFGLSVDEYGNLHSGTSVVLDPDGRIVVAGSRDNQLIVLRLLPNGSIDDSFGTSGIFAGPETHDDAGARTNILRTATGGYRITISNAAGCQVVALSAAGALDDAFGTSGITTVAAPSGPSASCSSIVAQADGRVLVAGNAAGQGFVARLLGDGQADPGFASDTVSNATLDATALAVAGDGSIVVAGKGMNGASIMRLQANGELDALFGNAGSTLIDLPSERGTSTVVHDLIVRTDGSVVGVGGEDYANQAFVVRLLGAGGGGSPGVLSVVQQDLIPTAEGAGEVVVEVRRSGGDSGAASAAYQLIEGSSGPVFGNRATAGSDYVDVAGRLTWEDGDTAVKVIQVPIFADGTAEEFEYFHVKLSDAQGGSGLGTRSATVQIAADGGPYGQFAIDPASVFTSEAAIAEVYVYRNFYSTGAVSVTMTPIAGTATAGDDFAAEPVTLSWADGESDAKILQIAIPDDTDQESTETFTLELSNPTGGAVIGPRSSVTIRIAANDRKPPDSGGGGALGYLSLLLLGFMTCLGFVRKALRSRLALPSG